MNLSSNAAYFPYLSMVDKYTGFADEYNKELSVFKGLLMESLNYKKLNSSNSSLDVDSNEITSNHISKHILSSPVVDKVSNLNIDEKYMNDDDDSNITLDSRDIAPSNISNHSGSNQKTLKLPKIQPLPIKSIKVNNNNKNNKKNVYDQKKTVKAKVLNRMFYKYEGRGFEIWKKNGRRPIYSETELFCLKVFGDDKFGIDKLKRYLFKAGGFKANSIEKVKVLTDSRNNKKFSLIKMRDSQKNIIKCIDKMNGNKKKEKVIGFYERQSNRYWRAPNKRLFIKNFDILNDTDHRKMTSMFLRFGELETDIFMNRDKNGNVYGFVHFRDIEDAIQCEKNQNVYSKRNELLWFNGRLLHIEYVDDSRKSRKSNNSKRRQNRRK